MKWMESKRVNGVRRVFVVENNVALVRALGRALPFSLCALLISKDDSMPDILNTLRDKNNDADVFYLDAQLMYKECPDPSYYGGLQIVKHIRIELLSRLPIVIGGTDTPTWLIRQAVDNIIILSSKCEAVKLPTLLADLWEALQRHQPFSSNEQMYNAIKPFVWITNQDKERKQLWEHAYRNRDGVFKFLTEFAGLSEEDAGYEHYKQQLPGELWFKKAQFLQAEQDPKTVIDKKPGADEKRTQMQNRITGMDCRFVYIDDEHWFGWSYGLYTGLFGCTKNSDLFDKGKKVTRIETIDKRLVCISKLKYAECFFKEQNRGLEEALKECASKKQSELKQQIMEPPPCDLVFLDLRLEGEDEYRPSEECTGIKLLCQIKSAFPDLPVIIVSASRDIRSLRESRRWGADGYWIKDISTGEELIDTIVKCLEKAELRAIWRAIRLVEEQDKIICHEWNSNTCKLENREFPKKAPELPTEQKLSLSEFQRIQGMDAWSDLNLIQRWLRESFQLLWDGEEIHNPSFHDEDYPYDRVILDTGLIQELRLKGLNDRDESKWKDVPFKKREMNLRRRRNEMAHPYIYKSKGESQRSYPAERQETIKFFKFTLNRLLDYEFFENVEKEI